MIVIEQVSNAANLGRITTKLPAGQVGVPVRNPLVWSKSVTVIEAAARSAAAMLRPTPVQREIAARAAREERMKQERIINLQKEPVTPLQVEARRRVTTYRAESKFIGDRVRFSKQLMMLPVPFKRRVRELIIAHGNYENLPGYSAFAAGRITVREMVADLEKEYKQLKAWQAKNAQGREAAWDLKHDLIEQQIDAERAARDAAAAQRSDDQIRIAQERSQRRRARVAAQTTQKSRKAADEKARKVKANQIRMAKGAEKAMLLKADRELHQFQPGSPPVSAAIVEVAEEMQVAPGELPSGVFDTLLARVFNRAQKLKRAYYYYKNLRARARSMYDTSKKTVLAILAEAGYRPGAAVQIRLPEPPTPMRPVQAQLPPGRPTAYTASADDPMVQEALHQAMEESGLYSGQEIFDIVAFESLVASKANNLTQTEGKIARRQDIQRAITARLRFVLNGGNI